jgi:hypothetical protein
VALMTRLQIVQRLREKTGGAGSGPSSTIGQTGEALRQVNWCDEAWLEIQTLSEDWKWMRKEFSFPTTIGKIAYLPTATAGEALVSDFGRWHDDTFRIWRTSTGRADEQFLVPWDYECWRDTFDFGLESTRQSRPMVWTERPADSAILLGGTPDAVYTVAGQYQSAPVALATNDATPGMPAKFHMLIVYKAMMYAGSYDAAPEVYAEGRDAYDRMLAMLQADQLEQIGFGEPLA